MIAEQLKDDDVDEPLYFSPGQICPRCNVAIGVAVADKIEGHNRVWHGPCFDRLPVPNEVLGCVDGVLESLVDRLSDGPDKWQLAHLHARFMHDAAKHKSPIGSARRNISAIMLKLVDMKDVPLALDRVGQVCSLAEAIAAIKAVVEYHIPVRHTRLRQDRIALAVGDGGLYYDRRSERHKHAA